MNDMQQRRIVLASRPEGEPTEANFRLETEEIGSPIIGLPLLVPALIGSARAAGATLSIHGSHFPQGKWLAIVALYDLVFALLAYAVFDFLLED